MPRCACCGTFFAFFILPYGYRQKVPSRQTYSQDNDYAQRAGTRFDDLFFPQAASDQRLY
jgi:hypothetical protein